VASFIWNDLIDRARVYVGDDHDETQGWIDPAKWLLFGQIEYASHLYPKWVRMGLVRPKPTDTVFAGTAALTSVLAIVGVAEVMSGDVRLLEPAQVSSGADPFWQPSSPPNNGRALRWAAHGISDSLTVELDPPDSATSYTVRWIPAQAYATDATSSVDLPTGGDERLVLGMARRALVKDGVRSTQLEALIADADAELTFTARARAGGARVRRIRRRAFPMRGRTWPANPNEWYYP
jgi:hypothetical protein